MKIYESCYVCVATYHHYVKAHREQHDRRYYLCNSCGGIFYEVYASWGSLDTTNMRQLMRPEDCEMCPVRREMKALAKQKNKKRGCKICKK